MKCEEVRDRLPAWVDKELDDATAQGISAHVEQCPECTREADLLRRLSELLRKSPDDDPPPGLRPRLMAELLQREQEKQPVYVLTGMGLSWTIGILPRGKEFSDTSTPVLTYLEYAYKVEPVESEPETIRYVILPHSGTGG